MVQRVYLDLPNESGPVLRIRGSEGDWRVLLWPARFHRALANWYQGDREAAKLIAEEISAPRPIYLGPPASIDGGSAPSACRPRTAAVDRVMFPFFLRHRGEGQRAARSRHGDCIQCETTDRL